MGLIESVDGFKRKKTEVPEEEESQPQTAFGRELQHHLFPGPTLQTMGLSATMIALTNSIKLKKNFLSSSDFLTFLDTLHTHSHTHTHKCTHPLLILYLWRTLGSIPGIVFAAG